MLGAILGAAVRIRPVETWGDYGRACSVQGYISLVDVGGQQAFVLGDEPASTTYLAEERLFLRWATTYSEAELIAAAKRALQDHGVPLTNASAGA